MEYLTSAEIFWAVELVPKFEPKYCETIHRIRHFQQATACELIFGLYCNPQI